MTTRLLLFGAVLISHLIAARGSCKKIRRNTIPSTADCAVISLLLFYDLATLLELCGVTYRNRYLPSLDEISDITYAIVMACLVAAPWLLLLGARIVLPRPAPIQRLPQSGLTSRPALFYGVAVVVTAAMAGWGVYQLSTGDAIWVIRDRVGSQWGPAVALLNLPCAVLACYLRQREVMTRKGKIFCCWLVFAAALTTAPVGQRTLVLQPFLIAFLFWPRNRFRWKTAAGLAGFVLLAALLLPVFKWQYADANRSATELLTNTLLADFSRTPVLATVVDEAPLVGSRIMPYPMAGYVYSALFFIPRKVAPFKGVSTASYITSAREGSDPLTIGWGLGVGFIEEILGNAGFLLLPVLLLAYGMVMGWLDNACRKVDALVIPLRCSGLWVCGYNLPALMLTFGIAAMVCLLLSMAFCRAQHARRKVTTMFYLRPHSEVPCA